MKFQKPVDAPEQATLLDLACAAGFERIAIQELFWSIDAHPNLLAFDQIAENLVAVLETPLITGLQESPVWNWRSRVPEWTSFCRWVADAGPELAANPALKNLFLAPRQGRKDATGDKLRVSHPLNHHGLSRHGVYAALWNRHESGNGAVTGGMHSMLYLALQGHLVFALASIRERCTRLEEYLEYDEEDEFSKDPRSSYAAALAVRNLSRHELTPLLEHLDPVLRFSQLVDRLNGIKERRDAIPGVDDELAIDYPAHLHSLFRATRDLIWTGHSDEPPIPRRTTSRATGAKRSSRHLPGYVNLSEHAYRYRVERTEDWAGSIDVVCLGKSPDDEFRDDELAGDAPVERERPVLALFSPEELKGAIARARTAERIRTLAAQRFAWDLAQPSAEQLILVRATVERCWNDFLAKPGSQQRQQEIQTALILEAMLLLGKDHEAARALKLRDAGSAAQIGEFALLVGKSEDGAPHAVGWRLPVIEADYRTDLPQGQAAHGRPRARSFAVPDLAGLGARVLEYARITGTMTAERAFTLHESTFLRIHQGLCRATPGLQEIGLQRLGRVLETTLYKQTGDWALAWMIGGDRSRAGESRLYYAGYAVEKLREAYAAAAGEILRRCGAAPSTLAGSQELDKRCAGARFIATLDSVRELLGSLRRDLKSFLPGGERTSEWIDYHNRYTLYTWLMQSLTTGTRPINDPTEIIDQLGAGRNATLAIALTDKETVFLDRARPVRPPNTLVRQLADYRTHASFIISALALSQPKGNAGGDMRLFWLTAGGRPARLDRGWVEEQLALRGHPFPGNFARAFLRAELVDRGCPAESVDALLGHASAGEKPFAAMSSFDYGRHFPAIADSIESVCRDIGLAFTGSRLLPR
jgi:hypothetical protein